MPIVTLSKKELTTWGCVLLQGNYKNSLQGELIGSPFQVSQEPDEGERLEA